MVSLRTFKSHRLRFISSWHFVFKTFYIFCLGYRPIWEKKKLWLKNNWLLDIAKKQIKNHQSSIIYIKQKKKQIKVLKQAKPLYLLQAKKRKLKIFRKKKLILDTKNKSWTTTTLLKAINHNFNYRTFLIFNEQKIQWLQRYWKKRNFSHIEQQIQELQRQKNIFS